MAFYLDTSEAVELSVAERESGALSTWIADTNGRILGSDLLRTELLRAVRRGAPDHTKRARTVLDAIDRLAPRTDVSSAHQRSIRYRCARWMPLGLID